VYDSRGRVVHAAKGMPGETFRFGANLLPGMYFAEVVQEGKRATVKLIKGGR
jgi:hypothetical protein